ncbi:hypothetical protein Dvina_34325 [Dactylosporangium vinaceum]|uniref:Uncharacterized protein n=1 Tax=Dactylosporangium vinaceum TaxID=53362 RepID=A0ABV5MM75_9ACTN|nr:hypothetical protein [Dactylosporangium vinaceum]UAB93320.1 hypothetical protein Dvina_34325 [Dactylosporangium vinaceum]
MTSRPALVIGTAPGDDGSPLSAALRESGYAVTELGAGPEATRNRCLDAIEAALEGVPDGATLLVYLAGPVVRIDGADYAVPADAGRRRPDRLIPLDLGAAAGAVVCIAGEGCTGALARRLRRHSAAATLGEVLAGTGAVWWSNRPDALELVVCDAVPPVDDWPARAEAARLWTLAGDDPAAARLRSTVRDQVTAHARTVRQRRAALAERTGLTDRWSDDAHPLRVLDRLYELLEPARLPAADVAALVAAPFRREAALAQRLDDVEPDPARLPRRAARMPEAERNDLTMWLAHQAADPGDDDPLLRLAGVLAADPRRMSAVLADHIGGPEPIDLAQVHETLATAMTWHRRGDALVLAAECPHPALYAALDDLVAEAARACRPVRGLVAGAPARCEQDLAGEELPRFQPAGGGDATSAVLELYRNARDACRFTHAGRIVFRQGVDEQGREYLECEDNGAARAAFPGAGASIADEALIWTTAGDSRLHTRIPAHGGLYRIHRDTGGPETAGTRVRLVLSAGVAVDVHQILAAHLVVAADTVEVHRAGAPIARWEPGVPRHPDLVRSRPRAGADRIWWIDGPAMLLAGGLLAARPAEHHGWIADRTGDDDAWVAAAVAASVPRLAGWDGFTYRWLWSVATAEPRLAQLIFEWHRSERLALDASAPREPLTLGAVGCLAQDLSVVLRATHPAAARLTGWRRAVWGRTGTDALAPADPAGFPVPEPLDGYVLQLIDEVHAQVTAGLGAGPGPSPLPAPAIRTSDVRYRARRFVLTGLDLARARPVGSGDPVATLLALGWPPDDGPASVRLLVAAARLGIALRVAAKWFGAGPEQGFVPDWYDVALFAADSGHTGAPWHPAVSHRRLQWAHDNWDLTADELRFRADRLRGAGYLVAFWTAQDEPATDPVTDFVRHLTEPPDPQRIAGLARDLGTTVAEAHQRVTDEAARLNAPPPAPLRGPVERVHPAEILMAAAEQGRPLQQAAAGLPLAQPIPAAAGVLHPGPDVAAALVRVTGGHGEWQPLAPHVLARLAERSGRTLEQQLSALAPYRHLGAPVPAIDPASAGYRPDPYDAALIEAAIAGPHDWTVAPLRLVLAAGRYGLAIRDAYARLARFRSYGLTLDVDGDACPDGLVYWPDPIVLSEFYDGAEPAVHGTVGAPAIRAAAAAVREKPAETRERLVRYQRMFGLVVEQC